MVLEKDIKLKSEHFLETCKKSLKDKNLAIIQEFLDASVTCIGDTEDIARKYIDVLDIAQLAVEEVGLGTTSVMSIFNYYLSEYLLCNDTISKLTRNDNSVLTIVNGLNKISEISTNKESSQAENYRKFLINLAVDIRVILIKLAEKLFYMRQIKRFSADEQMKLASEASYLYAPLAHRLGLYKVKSEMEDIWLKISDYETFRTIADKLEETAKIRNKFILDFIKPLKVKLADANLKFEIKGRPKSIFSIWNKTRKNKVSFEDIYDKFAIRIILDSEPEHEKSDCWKAYSIVTEEYQPNPLRLRDWISVPKSNGYESLHTTVVTAEGKWVEVQIRTIRMDEIAEKGFAAHWKYKGGKADRSGLDDWLTKVREMIENPEPDDNEFIDDFKLSLYSKEVFVFTPKGDLKKFPQGSTVLDFAYDIHSDVGSACVGAKVNGKSVPIRHELHNGDKIEVITSKNQKPKLDWLNFVVTSKAKSKIRVKLNESKVKYAELGKDIVKRRLKNWKLDYNDVTINKILHHMKFKTSQDFYYAVANEKIDLFEIKNFLLNAEEGNQQENEPIITAPVQQADKMPVYEKSDDFLIIDNRLVNIDFKLAKCCNPIYGDPVFGFVSIAEGIKIHRKNCPNANQLISRYGYRVVSAKWKSDAVESSFVAEIVITGFEELGILNKINDVITKDMGVTLRSLNIESNEGMFEGKIKVLTKGKNHLDGLIYRLAQTKGITKVYRNTEF